MRLVYVYKPFVYLIGTLQCDRRGWVVRRLGEVEIKVGLEGPPHATEAGVHTGSKFGEMHRPPLTEDRDRRAQRTMTIIGIYYNPTKKLPSIQSYGGMV